MIGLQLRKSSSALSIFLLLLVMKRNWTAICIMANDLPYTTIMWSGLHPVLALNQNTIFLSASAIALQTCMMYNKNEISFENVHKLCKKCAPKQITFYQMSLKLHKLLNEADIECSLEHVRVLDQIICMRRQLVFKIFKSSILAFAVGCCSKFQ